MRSERRHGVLRASGKAVWTWPSVVAVDAGSMQIQLCEGREAVAEIVESEFWPGSSWMPTLIAAGRILSLAIMLALRGILPFIVV